MNRGFNASKYLRDGSAFEKIIKKDQSLSELYSHIDIRKWAMEVKNAGHEDNDVLFHLMQVYLGTVETSSFVETMFSTAGQVWNEAHTNLGATPFECETILKKGKVLVKRYLKSIENGHEV